MRCIGWGWCCIHHTVEDVNTFRTHIVLTSICFYHLHHFMSFSLGFTQIKISAAVMINNKWWVWNTTADLTYVPIIASRKDFHKTQETNQYLTYDVESSLMQLARTYWAYRLNSSSGSGMQGSETLSPKHQHCTCPPCVSDPLVRDLNSSVEICPASQKCWAQYVKSAIARSAQQIWKQCHR